LPPVFKQIRDIMSLVEQINKKIEKKPGKMAVMHKKLVWQQSNGIRLGNALEIKILICYNCPCVTESWPKHILF